MTPGQALGLGVVLGLAAAVPIGPVNVELARRTLSRGWRSGVALGLGAVSVDVVYACLAVALAGGLAGSVTADRHAGPAEVAAASADRPLVPAAVFWSLAPASVALLSYLGGKSLRSAWRARQGSDRLSTMLGAADADTRLGRAYATGVAMTAVNPMTVVFWFITLPGQAVTRGVDGWALGGLAGGVFVGTAAWVLAFAGTLAGLGRWRRPWWEAVADALGGVLLLGFALLGLVAIVQRAGIG